MYIAGEEMANGDQATFTSAAGQEAGNQRLDPVKSLPQQWHRPKLDLFSISTSGTSRIMTRPILASCDLSGLYKCLDGMVSLLVSLESCNQMFRLARISCKLGILESNV